jgi:hypothetical protein
LKKKFTLPFLSLLFILQFLVSANSCAQIIITGTVYDSTKLYAVSGVDVYSTSGAFTTTDSVGGYSVRVSKSDSLYFFYKGKSTVKFPVHNIDNYTAFDISLRVRVNEKYKLLKRVTVFSDTYKRDSVENRVSYSKIFGRENPTIRSNYDLGGPAGFDLDELIGIFQFKKNKQNLAFQKRLVEEEQDRYVDYRFNSKMITRVTGLTGDSLLKYKKLYRPSYYFVSNSTLTEFYQYILNTSYAFRKEQNIER